MKEPSQDQLHLDSALNRMAPLLYVCILLPPFVTGLIGFNCGGHGRNITTRSLLDIGDCELVEIETIAEETYSLIKQHNYQQYQLRRINYNEWTLF